MFLRSQLFTKLFFQACFDIWHYWTLHIHCMLLYNHWNSIMHYGDMGCPVSKENVIDFWVKNNIPKEIYCILSTDNYGCESSKIGQHFRK